MQWLVKSAAAVAMMACLSANAQGTRAPLSLSSAVDLALRNDPRIKMAQADVVRARGALSETKDVYIPSVGATGGYGTSTGVPLSVPILVSITAQSLVFNFSQRDNLRAAEAALQAAELSLQEIREQISEDVIVTYLDLNHQQKRSAALSEEHGIASRLETIVQKRLDAGDDTKLELLKAQLTVLSIRQKEQQTDDVVANLEAHLARLVGLPGISVAADPASVPALPELSTLAGTSQQSSGVQAAFANALSKQEWAFGVNRYRLRPQIGFGANYSRIYTNHTNFTTYYPTFTGKNYNDYSIGIHVDFPLFDMGHDAKGREATAEAVHARAEAENMKNEEIELRAKLRHSMDELETTVELAKKNQEIAAEELSAVLVQLSATGAATGTTPLNPKDEQNARLAERLRFLDVIDAEYGVQEATVHLMRQTGQLEAWLNSALHTPATVPTKKLKP